MSNLNQHKVLDCTYSKTAFHFSYFLLSNLNHFFLSSCKFKKTLLRYTNTCKDDLNKDCKKVLSAQQLENVDYTISQKVR